MKWRIFLYAVAVGFALIAVLALVVAKFPLESREIVYRAAPPFSDDEADARIERKVGPFLEKDYLGEVDIKGAQAALSELDWVEFCSVRRSPPSTIVITVKPKRIIGSVVLADGGFMPVDSRGKMINERFAEAFLPLVAGPGGAARLPRLLAFLSDYPEIKPRLKSANRIHALRWDLTIAGKGGDVLLRLPADEAARALVDAIRTDLLSGTIAEVDMRAGSKIFVKER